VYGAMLKPSSSARMDSERVNMAETPTRKLGVSTHTGRARVREIASREMLMRGAASLAIRFDRGMIPVHVVNEM